MTVSHSHHTSPPPASHAPESVLAWSEARVDQSDDRGPCIGLWQPAGTTVAIGIGQTPAVELDVDAMRRDGVGLIRRQSGGGAVLLYAGVLCWEAWAGFEEIVSRSSEGSDGIRETYRVLCGPVIRGLAALGIRAFHAGICDISTCLEGGPEGETPRKLAGTAQLRRKNMALVHGSLLVCPDLSLLPRYLKFPSSQPEYRAGRSHRDFCVSVRELRGDGSDDLITTVAEAVTHAATEDGWRVAEPVVSGMGTEGENLEHRKYRSAAWNWDRVRPALG